MKTKLAIKNKGLLENTSKIGRKEMCWSRTKPGELKPKAFLRFAKSVWRYPFKPEEKEYIHTHLCQLKDNERLQIRHPLPNQIEQHSSNVASLPSPQDLSAFCMDLRKSEQPKVWHIISIGEDWSKEKKELEPIITGLVSMRATKRFVKIVKDDKQFKEMTQRINAYRRNRSGSIFFPPLTFDYADFLRNMISVLKKHGLQVRPTPAAGYRFGEGRFYKDYGF